MSENKLPFAKDAFMFSGLNYQFWKICIKTFIESIDQGIWLAIYDEWTIHSEEKNVNDEQVNKTWNLWTEEEKRRLNMILLPKTS